MDYRLKDFMEKRFPAGNTIRIDHPFDDEDEALKMLVGKDFLIESIEDDGLHCTDANGNSTVIDPEKYAFYKLNQPPILAYGCDDEPAELTDVRQIAEFIINNGNHCDISMYTKDTDEYVLNTMGIYLDHIADMDFRDELLTILVPLQQQYPFGMPKKQEEAETASDAERKIVEYNGTKVYFEISDYYYDPSVMALSLFSAADNEPYATLSVNLPEHDPLKPNQTFIDTNNCFGAEAFLESLDGAKKVTVNGIPVTGRSGYCTYPLYEFDEKLLCELDAAGYKEHLENCITEEMDILANEVQNLDDGDISM